MNRPIPALPATFEEFDRRRAAAVETYRPLIERLGLGELVGLSESVTAELARRETSLEATKVRERRLDRSGIGNR